MIINVRFVVKDIDGSDSMLVEAVKQEILKSGEFDLALYMDDANGNEQRFEFSPLRVWSAGDEE